MASKEGENVEKNVAPLAENGSRTPSREPPKTPPHAPVAASEAATPDDSLRLALELQRQEEQYMAAQREGEARLAELDDEEDESLVLAWRLQQEEDDRALFLALNGGREVPEGALPRNVSPSQMTYDELTALGENLGTVSKGTSRAAIDQLPTMSYEAAKKNAIVGEQCAICRLEFQADDILRVLPCRHAEHAECIDQWLVLNRCCPLCQKEVAPRDGI